MELYELIQTISSLAMLFLLTAALLRIKRILRQYR